MSSPIQRSLASRRVYVRQGPEPKCPTHGRLTYTLGGWRCRGRDVRGRRCLWWLADRRETEVEAWEEPDDGISFGGERQ